MTVRRLPSKSWFCDFELPGHPRQRTGGYRTKAEAKAAERKRREETITGAKSTTLVEAFERYISVKDMRDRSRDTISFLWNDRIKSEVGHRYIEDVTTDEERDLLLDGMYRMKPQWYLLWI
jgi:hypothetical protein